MKNNVKITLFSPLDSRPSRYLNCQPPKKKKNGKLKENSNECNGNCGKILFQVTKLT